MGTTTKKVKVIGREQRINPYTGEMEDFEVVSVEDRDFNFHKVWLESIISSMDLLGNQKIRLAFWIIAHLNKENQIVMTQRQISEQSGISLKTVSVTMKTLLESNFLRKINGGAYCVNPDVLFKGTRNGRMNVLIQYNSLEQIQKAEEETAKAKEAEPQRESEPRRSVPMSADGSSEQQAEKATAATA